MNNIFEFKINIDRFDQEAYYEMKHEYVYYDWLLELKDNLKRRIPLVISPSYIINKIKISINYTLGFITNWEFDKIEVMIFSHCIQFMNSLDDIDRAYIIVLKKQKIILCIQLT